MKQLIALLTLPCLLLLSTRSTSQTVISAGGQHVVAIKTDGTLWAWGSNSSGQVGIDPNINSSAITSPTQIGTDNHWMMVSAGYTHNLALKSDSTLWVWGSNQYGELGNSNQGTDEYTPIQIGTSKWIHISAGMNYSFAIRSDGALFAWGNNQYGQLGTGSSGSATSKSSPFQIGSATNWAKVVAGMSHSLALKTDGTLWAWGRNNNYQIGDNTNTNRTSPIQIGTSTWSKIAVGGAHSLAIQTDGSLWSWGFNSLGQLGDGSTTIKRVPTKVGSALNWSYVSANTNHSHALKLDGTLWAWGANSFGEYGNGTTSQSNSPIQVGSETNWTFVQAGELSTVGLKSTDNYYCATGDNSSGQLGTGSNTSQTSFYCSNIATVCLVTTQPITPVCGETSRNLGEGISSDTLGYTITYYSNAAHTNAIESTVSAAGTYYVTAAKSGCSVSDSIVVNSFLANPTAPTGSNAAACGNGITLTLSAAAPSGSTVDWYASSSSASPLLSGSGTYTTPSISFSKVYYAQSRNTTSGCVSTSRTPVLASVNSISGVPNVASYISSGLNSPAFAAFDASNNLYISDAGANIIKKINPGGAVSNFVTSGLNTPSGLAFDNSGNLYIANSGANNILKVTSSGTVSTFASSGINNPTGLVFDEFGNLFVTNTGTNGIIKITPSGTVSTFLASGLNNPSGLTIDASGNLYAANTSNNTISRVTKFGVRSTFISTNLNSPTGLTIDPSGNLYIVNSGTNSIIKHNSFAGDTSVYVNSGFSSPKGITLDNRGNLYVVNSGDQSLSKITLAPPSISSFSPSSAPTNDTITVKGFDFGGTISVNFGTTSANSFNVVNDTIIKAIVGIGSTGNIMITNKACSTTSASSFSYCVRPAEPTAIDTTICQGSTATVRGSGVGTLGWYSAATGGTYLGGGSTYTTPALNTTTNYYLQDSTCASSATRKLVSVTVDATSVSGSISGAGTVCTGTNSTLLTLSGNTGSIQWQSSTDNTNFTNIVSATSSTYTASNLTSTTYYRAVVTNGVCSAATSSSVTVTVSPTTVAGTISGANTVCASSNNTLLSLTGNTGTAQWQSSSDNTNFTDINGATSSTYNVLNLTSTTYYRAVVTSGACAFANTTSVTMTVDPVSVAGSISGAATVCTGTNSTTLSVSGNTGSIQWQSSTDNLNFANIGGATGSSYVAANLTQTTYYRVVVTSGVCSRDTSSVSTITVSATSVSGTVSGGKNVCTGTNSTILSVTGNTGSIQWQESSDNTNFTDITGEVSANYTATNLTSVKYYRVKVTSGACSAVFSNSTAITIDQLSLAGTASGDTTICTGTNSATVRLTGNRGSIQWQESSDGTTYSNISGATSSTYTSTNYTATTYYKSVVTNGACSSATSAAVTVMVSPVSVAGSISGATTVCTGTNSTLLTLSGNTGAIQWQISSDNSNFTDINSATAQTYTVTNLTASRYYRAVVTSGACSSSTTSSVTMSVSTASAGGTVSGSATVCTGTNSTTLTLSGYNGSIQWQSSSNNISFTNIGSATSSTYSADNLTATTYYRAVVTSGVCAADISTTGTVTVSPLSVAGSISGAGAVCYGTNTKTLTLSGYTGSIQWQSSTDNINFTDINSATSSTYTATNLTATTYYRAVVTSGACSAATSTSVTVTVSPTTVAGTISGAGAVCTGTNSKTLTLNSYTGGVQWQNSVDNIVFTDISGETGSTYTAANLTQGTYYRAVVISGVCLNDTTQSVNITVDATSVSGSISGAGTVCTGTNSTLLTLSGNTGSIQWQSSADNTNFTNIVSATSSNYTASNLTSTTYYRAVVTNGVCSAATSSSVTVTVSPTTVAGSISGATTVCASSNNTLLSLTGNTGTAQWQSSSDNTSFTDINGATSSTYNVLNLTSTTYYRAVVTSGACAFANTTSVTMTVDPVSVAGSISGAATVCTGTNSTTLSVSGNTGSIQWQSSTDNLNFANIGGSTGSSYVAANLTQTTYYRVVVTSGVCSRDTSSVSTITVSATSVSGTVSGGTNVCTGTNSTILSVTGNTGSIQWQESSDNTNFTDITGEVSANYTAMNLTSVKYYRAKITSGACSAVFSNSTAITIDQLSLAGTASGDTTICTGTNSATVRLTGNRGTIQWQESSDGTTYSNISGATSSTYTSTNYTATNYYKAVVTNGACSSATSAAVTVMVSPVSVAGSISGATTVCTGTNSTVLTLSGNTGSIQWQVSTNNTSFTNIASATGQTYTVTNLTAVRYYRAVITSGACSSATSSSVTMGVSTASVGGTVSGSATVCTGTNSTTLTLSGYNGSIQWQSSTDNISFANIGSATSSTYSADNLTATTYYRAVVTSGVCAADISTTGTVTVSPLSVAGSISGAGAVCYGTNTKTLTLSGYTGSIQWQSSTNNVSFSNINSATSSTYTATNLTVTTYYRAVLTSGSCSSVTSSSVAVTVNSVSVAGTISGSTSACAGTNSTTLTLSGHTGTIQWQSSLDNTSFTDITGETASTFTAVNISATTYYRAVVTNGVCSSANSSVFTLSLLSLPPTPTGSDVARCNRGTSTISASSGTGTTIDWYSLASGGTAIVSGSTSYTTPNLTTTTTYYAQGRTLASGCLSSERKAIVVTINNSTYNTTTTSACDSIRWNGTKYTTSGNYTYSYVNASGCISVDTLRLTINTSPTVAAISGSTAVCTGSTLQLTDATASGVWTSSNTAVATVSNTGLVTGISGGIDTVYYTVTAVTGCSTAVRKIITVTDIPTIVTTTPGSTCGNGTVLLQAASSAGTLSWYAASSGGSALGTGTSYTTSSISTNTTYYVSASINGCTSGRTSVAATIKSLPVVTSNPSTTPQVLSVGVTPATFSITATGTSLTYQWYVVNTNANTGGTLIPGATSSTYTPSTANLGVNFMYAVVTSGDGCKDTSDVSGAVAVKEPYYWVGGTGNWSDFSNHWAKSSGGTSFHTQIPTSGDNVYFDANSFTAAGQTVTLNAANPTCNNLSFTGVQFNPTFTGPTQTLKIYGSLTLVTGMTANLGKINFESVNPGQTIATGSQMITGDINFNGIGGGWTLQDSLRTNSSSTIYLNYGNLNTNNQNVTTGKFLTNNTNTRSLTLGNSTMTLLSNAGWSEVWYINPTGLTFSGSSATINMGRPDNLLMWPYFRGGNYAYAAINCYSNYDVSIYGKTTITNVNLYRGNAYINNSTITNLNVMDSLNTSVSLTADTITNVSCNTSNTLNLSGSNVITNLTRAGIGSTTFNFSSGQVSRITNFNHTSSGGVTFLDSAYILTAIINGDISTRKNIRFGVLNFTGGAGKTYTLASHKTMNIDSSLTFASGDCNGMLNLVSDTVGRQTTIAMRSGTGDVTINFVNLRGSVITGSGNYTASNAIDLSNNSGWYTTTLTSHDYYWIGGTGNWNDGNHWSTSSGGPAAGCGPTLVDNVHFDANSFSASGQTVTLNSANPSCKNMDWTGVTNSPTFSGASQILNIYGSLTFISGMTTSLGRINFEATTSGNTITMAGQVLTGDVNFNGIGGAWTLQDSLKTNSSSTVYLNNGSLNTNNQNIITGKFLSNNTNTRSLTLGTSTIILLNSGGWQTIWQMNQTGLSFSGASSTINFGRLSSLLYYPYFYGGNQTYGTINNYTTGHLLLLENNRFNDINVYKGGLTLNNAVATNVNFYDSLTTALSLASDTITNVNCNATGEVNLSLGNIITNFNRSGTGNTIFNYDGNVPKKVSRVTNFNHTSSGSVTFLDSAHILTANIYSDITTRKNIKFGVLNLLGGPSKSYTLASNKTIYIDTSFAITSGNCNGLFNLNSDAIGSQSNIVMRSGTGNVSLDFLNLRGIAISGSATYSVSNAINLGDNSGWVTDTLLSHNYYWIGGTGNWNDGSHWSTSSGGPAANCGPTLVDNVYFDANSFTTSGQTVTLNAANPSCRNMDWTGAQYSPTFTGASQTLNIYGSLKFITGMTTSLGKVNFEATTTGNLITMGSQILAGDVNFNGIGGGWTMQDSLKTNSSSFVYLNNGSLNTNNQKIIAGRFISNNNNTRSLTLGSSIVTLLNNGGWTPIWYINGSGMTFSGASATINMGRSDNYLSWPQFYGGGKTYSALNIYAAYNLTISDNNNTFTDVRVYRGDAYINGSTITNLSLMDSVNASLNLNTDIITNVTCNSTRDLVLDGNNTITNLTRTGVGNTTFNSGTNTIGKFTCSSTGTAVLNSTNTIDTAYFYGNTSLLNNNTIGSLYMVGGGITYIFGSGKTQTILNTLEINGASGGAPVYFNSSTQGSYASIVKATDAICTDYVRVRDIHTSGGAYFVAGPSSQDLGNNTGWTFINVVPTPVITISPSVACQGFSKTYTASYVNGGLTRNFEWQVNGATVQNSSSNTYTTSSMNTGDVVRCIFSVRPTPCSFSLIVNSNSLNMTVNPPTEISTTSGASRCDSGTVSLTATATNGSVDWFAAASGDTAIYTGNSFTTPFLNATTTYYVAPSNGCTTSPRVPVTATINYLPNITSSTDGFVCDSGTVSLSAVSDMSATVNWYAAATGGSSLGTGNSFTTPSISSTRNYYVSSTSSAGCTSSSRSAVAATVYTTPSITSTVTENICGTGTATLAATASAGTINWYADSTGGSSLGTGASFTTPNLTQTTRYYVDATANGCTTRSRTSLTVRNDVAPVANCKNITIQLGSGGTATITGTDVNNNSTDDCGIASYSVSPSSFNCSNLGANTVTLTVTNSIGISSTCTSTVTVEDQIAPVAISKNITVYLDSTGSISIAGADVNNNSTDNCGISTYGLSSSNFTCFNLGANTVTLTVTDASGNSSTTTAIVTISDTTKPTITTASSVSTTTANNLCVKNVTITDAVISDNCSATVSYTLSGATTQSSTSGQVGTRSFNTGVTTIIYTATDASGNTKTASMTVTVSDAQLPSITPAADVSTVSTNSSCGASVAITDATYSDNCSANIAYELSGATTQSSTAGQVGTHIFNAGVTTITYTVTDASNNIATASMTVTILPTIRSQSTAPQTICKNVAAAAMSVTAVGTGLSYQWYSNSTASNTGGSLIGGATSASYIPSTSAAGTSYYYCVVSNANSCSETSNISGAILVNELPSPTISNNTSTTFCAGDSVTLSTGSFNTYLWSTGATNSSINVKTSGNYTVTVTDSNGCTSTSPSTQVVVNTLPTPVITAGGATTFCNGGSVNLSTTSYSGYLWSTGATSDNIAVTTSGSYTVAVTDGNGCVGTSSATTVTVNPLPAASVVANTSICLGNSTSIGATSVSGNTYSWSPSTGLSSTTSSNPTATPTVTTTYTLTETITATGCTNSQSVTVTVNPLPAAGAGNNQTICLGQSTNIGATAVSGSTYSWSPTTGLSSATASNPTATPTQTITYTLTETITTTGCYSINTVAVIVNPLPAASVTSNQDICVGDSVSIGATTVAGSTYSWSPTGGLSSATSSNPKASPSSTTTYTLTETITATGCTKSNTITVTVNPLPTASISGTATVCKNSSSPLVTFTGANGTAPYTFTYTINGGAAQTVTTTSGNSITVSASTAVAGSFVYDLVSVVDASSTTCAQSQSGSAIIYVNAITAGSIIGSQTICYNGDPAAFTSVASTGNGTVSYVWESNTNVATPNWQLIASATGATYDAASGLTATTQYRRISTSTQNSVACSAEPSNVLTVTVQSIPSAGIIAGNQTICNGGDPSIFTSVTNGSGDGTINYRWEKNTDLSTPSWNAQSGSDSALNIASGATFTTQYRRITISTLSGISCESSPTNVITDTVQSTPTAGLIAGNQTICSGGDPDEFTSNTDGVGDGAITYRWEKNTNLSTPNWISQAGSAATLNIPSGLSVTTQYRRITISTLNNISCESTNSNVITVTVNALPASGSLTKSPNTIAVCDGANVSAVLTSGSGGSGNISDVEEYRFDNSGSWSSYTDGSSISTTGHTAVTIRTYRIADGSGCTTSTPVETTWNVNAVPASGSLSKTPNTSSVCIGTNVSAVLTAGTGGAGTITDLLQYRFDDTGSWSAYTDGTNISTTGHSTVAVRTYRTADGSSCTTSSPTEINWQIDAQPVAAAGPNQTLCSTTSMTMAAVPTIGTGLWSFVGSAGTASITTPSSAVSTITSIPTNQNITIRWTETNGACSSYDEVVIRNDAQVTSASAGTDQIQCASGSFTLAANTPTSGVGAWTKISGTASITDTTLYNSGVTGVPANGTAVLRWTVTNGTCISTDEVSLTNDAQVTTAAAGLDQRQCASGSFTLAGNQPTSGTGVWTVTSGTATVTSASSYNTGVTGVPANGTAVLRWTITNGTCSSYDEVSLTNDAQVTTANAGTDQRQCASGSFTLAGNTTTSGVGAWTITSGTATIADTTLYNSGVTSVPANGTAVLRWTVTNGTCISTDEVSLTNDAQVTTAAAGLDQRQCASGSFTLAGNQPTSGTGVWTVTSGTATITSASSYNSGVTGVPANGTAVLRWTVTNGTCSSYDEVSLTNDAQVTTANAGTDQRQCASGSFTLAANTSTSGTGAWTITSGTATIADTTLYNSAVTSVPANGTAVLRWTVTNGTCISTDEVSLTNDAQVTTANAGSDQRQCASGSFTLAGNQPTSGTGVWTVTSGTATITSASSYNSGVTGVPANGTAVLRWTITNGTCSSYDEVALTNDDQVTTSSAGSDQSQCNSGAFTLAGNQPSSGTGLWTVTSGTATITSPSTYNSGVTGVPAGSTVVLRWTITNGTCISTDEVSLTNDQAPTAANAGSDQSQCNSGSFTLSGNTASVGQGTWTLVSGTATISSLHSETSGVTGVPTGGTAVLRWTIVNGTCSTSDEVSLTNDAQPLAVAGADQNLCNATQTTMAAVASLGTGAWSFYGSSGSASITNTSSATTTITSLINNTNYTLVWTETNGTCTSRDTVVVRNYSQMTSIGGSDQSLCNQGTFTMSATPTIGTGVWRFVGTHGTASITDSTSATTSVTNVPFDQDITLRWTESNGSCSSSDTVVIRNDAPPSISAGTDQVLCNTSTITMAGSASVGNGTWTFIGSYGTAAITNNTSSSTTITTVPVNNNISLQWNVVNGTCSAKDTVVIRNNEMPAAANAGTDQVICNSPSFTITGNSPSIGTATWSIMSGSASIASASSASTTISGVAAGATVVIRWTIVNGNCSTFDEVTLINNIAPPTVSVTDGTRCGTGTVTLSAIPPTGKVIDWYDAVSGGNLLASATSTYTTPSINSTSYYFAQVRDTSNGCISLTRTMATATVHALPSTPSVTGAARCSTGSVSLSATSGTGEAIDWYAASIGGSALSTGSATYTTPSISATTIYYVETRNTTTGCTSLSRTAVTATVNPLPPTPTVAANGPTTFFYGGSVELSAPSVGNALSLDGVGNYVELPSSINSSFSSNRITIEGWFYANQTFDLTSLVGESSEGDNKIRFALFSTFENNVQKIKAGFYSVATGWVQAVSSTNLTPGQWTHIAATYDQTNVKIYVNGNLAATMANSNAMPTGNERWLLGKRWDSNNFFPGKMDEVRIWNIAKTQSQIQSSMNTTISPSSTGLVGYYKMDETSGNTVGDSTGNGNDGTLH